MENRAAVFTSQPQAVEVYQAGTWWAGELLGWRHDANGSCQVWVRVVLGGVEETAWTDLETLRLPERHLAVAPDPSPSRYAPPTQEMSVARHPSGRRARSADADGVATTSLPMARDLSAVPDRPDGPSAGGRRRAPEEPLAAPSGGHRRAPEVPAPVSVGGRRRAPEPATAESPAVLPAPGRHRAGDPGRHRTADTGLFPVVADGAGVSPADDRSAARPAGAGRRMVPAARSVQSAEASRATWTAPEGLDPELLTRPMRLGDQVPHSRRPRLDGSLRGV
jgi:hypothetical protein